MSYQAIINKIKSGKTPNLILLYGEESYYIDKVMDFCEKNLMDEGMRAFNQSTLYGKEVDAKRVMDELAQFPMMASHRVILLKEAQDMKTFNDLLPIFEKPIPHGILVISYKKAKVDKRTKAGKALMDHAESLESKPLYDNQVPAWIQEYAKEIDINLDREVANILAEFLGSDLKKIANELDKLKLTFGTSQTITIEDVQEQIGISKDFNVFELQKALGMKDVVKSNLIVNYFKENPKSNPIQMSLSSLYSYFTKIYITMAEFKQPDNVLMKSLGLGSPYFVKDYRQAARNYNYQKVRSIIERIYEADLRSKGVDNRSMSDGDIMKELVYYILH